MKNPYEVLSIGQDASKAEIHKAFINAQIENSRTKKYSGKELMEAQKQLMNPGKRLVADFLFPSRLKTKRLKQVDLDGLSVDENALQRLNEDDRFDSLNAKTK